MRENKYGEIFIDEYDFDRWCSCFNFPHQKCGDCRSQLEDIVHFPIDKTEIKLK